MVPRSAVLDTGTRKIVYVAKPDGVFEAREVAVGEPSEDLFPVTSGLAKGDKVVLSGNFLIDSQAHLSSGMSGMYDGSKEFAENQAGPVAVGTAEAGAAGRFSCGQRAVEGGEDNTFRASVTVTCASVTGFPSAPITLARNVLSSPAFNGALSA